MHYSPPTRLRKQQITKCDHEWPGNRERYEICLVRIGVNESAIQSLGEFLFLFEGSFGGFPIGVEAPKPGEQHETA